MISWTELQFTRISIHHLGIKKEEILELESNDTGLGWSPSSRQLGWFTALLTWAFSWNTWGGGSQKSHSDGQIHLQICFPWRMVKNFELIPKMEKSQFGPFWRDSREELGEHCHRFGFYLTDHYIYHKLSLTLNLPFPLATRPCSWVSSALCKGPASPSPTVGTYPEVPRELLSSIKLPCSFLSLWNYFPECPSSW